MDVFSGFWYFYDIYKAQKSAEAKQCDNNFS